LEADYYIVECTTDEALESQIVRIVTRIVVQHPDDAKAF